LRGELQLSFSQRFSSPFLPAFSGAHSHADTVTHTSPKTTKRERAAERECSVLASSFPAMACRTKTRFFSLLLSTPQVWKPVSLAPHHKPFVGVLFLIVVWLRNPEQSGRRSGCVVVNTSGCVHCLWSFTSGVCAGRRALLSLLVFQLFLASPFPQLSSAILFLTAPPQVWFPSSCYSLHCPSTLFLLYVSLLINQSLQSISNSSPHKHTNKHKRKQKRDK